MDVPMIPSCQDFWTWNIQDKSPEVQVGGENNSEAYFHPVWSRTTAAVRGTRILNNGRYYWELQLSERVFGTSMMFGVATKQAKVHFDGFIDLVGDDENGWGLSHKGLIFHAGKKAQYTQPFQHNTPTTIGILFDGVSGNITYFKDGFCLGVAFKNLNNVMENLYPIISSTAAKTKITLSVMKKDIVSLQERCRAVIISQSEKPSDLDNIILNGRPLPKIIKNFIKEAFVNKEEEETEKQFS